MLLFFCLLAAQAFGEKQFVKMLGGPYYDIGYAAIQTRDGGYAVAGETESFGSGLYDVLLAKCDSFGNPEWTRSLGEAGNDRAYSLIQTVDGGYAIAGETGSFGADSGDVLLAKFDAFGNVQWVSVLNASHYDVARCLIQTTDRGYALTGWTQDLSSDADVLIAKFDSLGDHEWTRTLGGQDDDCAHSIVQTVEDGYAVAGGTFSFGAEYRDIFLAKLDSSGGCEWSVRAGGQNDEVAYDLVQTTDGGFALAGETFSFGAQNYDLLLAEFDFAGGHRWTRMWGGLGIDRAYSLIQTADEGYILTGRTDSYGAGCQDVLLAKFGSSGDGVWGRTLGGISVDRAYSVSGTTDGGCVLVGQVKSFAAGLYDVLLAKCGESGELCLGDSIDLSIDTVLPSVSGVTLAIDTILPIITDVSPAVVAAAPTMTILCENVDFVRSDGNGDMVETIADGVYIINYIYRNGLGVCEDACDVNDDGRVTSADAVYLVNHIYRSGLPPPDPFPGCGWDPTPDRLGCGSYTCP